MSDKEQSSSDSDSTSDSKVHSPHDKFVRSAIQNLPIAKELIIYHLPVDVHSHLDLDKIELVRESHLDEKLKLFMSDIILKCPYKNAKDANDYAKIPILIEHQSSPDELIAFRVHHYLINFVYTELKRTKSKKLTAAYAIVLYHGKPSPYPYSTKLIDCFDDPHGIIENFLTNDIKIIDVGQIPDETLKKRKLLGVIQTALKHSRDKHPEPHIIQAMRQISILDIPNSKELQSTIRMVLSYWFSVATSFDVKEVIEAATKIPKSVRGEYMTIAEQLEARGKAEGEVEKAIEIAINLFSLGLPDQTIAQTTGLALKRVIELRAQHGK